MVFRYILSVRGEAWFYIDVVLHSGLELTGCLRACCLMSDDRMMAP